MHPDDELKKRLRERFASFEPEPETSWQEFERRLDVSPKPVRRKGRIVVAILLTLLLIGGIGFWISQPSRSMTAIQASKGKSTISKPLFANTDKSRRDVKKRLLASHQELSRTVSDNGLPIAKNSVDFRKAAPNPLLLNRSSNRKGGTGRIVSLAANEEKNPTSPGRYFEKNEPLLPGKARLLPRDLLEDKIFTMSLLKPRQVARLAIEIPPPHLFIPPANKELSKTQPPRPQPTWVIKAGPLLGYSGMSSIVRENNSAVHLENLRASLPERLGWHLYVGQQRPLSHGRKLEIGAMFRQFGQGIRYQVPNGAYSVVVQPDQSATVTQLRDTLSDQVMIRQAGLRLGYLVPVLPAIGLYGSVGGEAMYQFNLQRVVMNAEVLVGKTLTNAGPKAITIELFANTAIRPVNDSHGWVRILPYHVGLRVGVSLGRRKDF